MGLEEGSRSDGHPGLADAATPSRDRIPDDPSRPPGPKARRMWRALLNSASRLWDDLWAAARRPRAPAAAPPPTPRGPERHLPLDRVRLTDGVARTLFEEFAHHRAGERGEDETGWLLVGLREAREAVVLGTLPAGGLADAGVAHVRFNSTAQTVGSRIVRQHDRRLTTLGVVHTHPGSLRHPSDGDYRGDVQWVGNLRGGEGVFGIGTADADSNGGGTLIASQPRPHVQCLGQLRFSWYALGHRDTGYRPLPLELTIGPDLARPLHPLWPVVEAHAEAVERLYRQQAAVRFDMVDDEWGRGLALVLPLAGGGEFLRVVLRPKEVRYYLFHGDDVSAIDLAEPRIDRGVYQILAELSAAE